MNYEQIHTALTESTKSGEIRSIVMSFIDHETVLSASSRQYAEEWLNYSTKELTGSHRGIIRSAVNSYCYEFINSQYSGKLDEHFNAVRHLSEYETTEFYESEKELAASGKIFHALFDYSYCELAIESIFNENWQ